MIYVCFDELPIHAFYRTSFPSWLVEKLCAFPRETRGLEWDAAVKIMGSIVFVIYCRDTRQIKGCITLVFQALTGS